MMSVIWFQLRADSCSWRRPAGVRPVVLRLALVLGLAPLAGDEALVLEAVQRRIEGPLLDFQAVFGNLLDAQQDAVAVQRAERDGFQNQHVERALHQIGLLAHSSPPRLSRRTITQLS